MFLIRLLMMVIKMPFNTLMFILVQLSAIVDGNAYASQCPDWLAPLAQIMNINKWPKSFQKAWRK